MQGILNKLRHLWNISPLEERTGSGGRLGKAFDVLGREIDAYSRRRLIVAFSCVIFAAIAGALAPVALKTLVDGLSAPVAAVPVFALGGYLAANFLARCVNELRWLLFGGAEQRIFRRLSRSLFSHIMTLPLPFHLGRKTGAIGQTLENGLVGYRLLLQHAIFTILPAIVEIAAMALIVASLFPPIFLGVLLAFMGLYGVVFARGAARVVKASRNVSTAKIDAHAILTDSILNYETVKLFTAETVVRDRYDALLAQSEEKWREFYRRRTTNGLSVACVFVIALAAMTGLAATGVARGALTIGEFVLLNAYLLQISRPVEMLGFAFRDVGQGAAFIEKLLELLDEPPEPQKAANAARRGGGPASLAFENVSFAYQGARPVLSGVSFEVGPGRTTAIVGPSGSGKSSIIRLLMRFYEPSDGRILIDGSPARDLPLEELRAMIAVVPQDTILFNDTLGYNIGFGASDPSKEDISSAALLADLGRLIGSLPEGLATKVGERGLKLSGGEKQRVAIARAALKHPRIFAFDEATSALDTNTERRILKNLIDVSEGVTTIMIAHRLSTVIHADEVIVLEAGEIKERGAHAALLKRDGLYAQMWRSQNEAARRMKRSA